MVTRGTQVDVHYLWESDERGGVHKYVTNILTKLLKDYKT